MARRCVAWAPSFISAVSTPLRNLCAPHLAYLPSWSRRRSHSTHPPPSPLVLASCIHTVKPCSPRFADSEGP
ncbi:hypothetical protein FPQ18DRAFT_356171 [Pyronema domesticum]|nr:hypothetical protein FPQ18DRAFT_356171 [Pyronema domesticum]